MFGKLKISSSNPILPECSLATSRHFAEPKRPRAVDFQSTLSRPEHLEVADKIIEILNMRLKYCKLDRCASNLGAPDWDYDYATEDSLRAVSLNDFQGIAKITVETAVKLMSRHYYSSQRGDFKKETDITEVFYIGLIDLFQNLPKNKLWFEREIKSLQAVIACGCQMLKGQRHIQFVKEVTAGLESAGIPWSFNMPNSGVPGTCPYELQDFSALDRTHQNLWMGLGLARLFGTVNFQQNINEPDQFGVFIGADPGRGDPSLL